METYFAREYPGTPFRFFSPAHRVALLVVVLVNLVLFLLRRTPPRPCPVVRNGLATVLIVNEGAWHAWNWKTGQWDVQTMLPLHLCSASVFLSTIMLVTRSYALYEVLYFMGIGGALQALLTPDLMQYGFPHFRFFQTFLSHGALVTAPVYMTVVEGYRPTPRSVARVLVGLNLCLLPVAVLNRAIGSNYLFIARKPDMPTLLDVLGPWPWYILSMQAIGAGVVLVLYLPFAFRDWQRKNGASRRSVKSDE
ncbi:MAG: TIGR02206 family membrane protein [Chloroflexaceae bacterium]|nr:TIGR02206 family membrane protein [Chloroflexaceae bacterium]